MASGPPPSSSAASSTSAASLNSSTNTQRMQSAQQHSKVNNSPSNVYSFSVHQPYTNWPLHASGSHYPTSWYPVATQYTQPKTYRDNQTQTPSNGDEAGKHALGRKLQHRRSWDDVLCRFLKAAGLFQALRGFEDDILVMNEEWECKEVTGALSTLVEELMALQHNIAHSSLPTRPLEDRKLDYVKSTKGAERQTPTAFTKSISRFLAQSRKRNDASNRAEFLQTLAEKRRKLNPPDVSQVEGVAPCAPESAGSSNDPSDGQEPSAASQSETDSVPLPSCARTDAKPQDRDVQMKYDIARNEDGPLKRTMRTESETTDPSLSSAARGMRPARVDGGDASVTAERHPGLAGRLADVETHVAVRYVPSPPQSLMDRIRFLEDYIIKLEKEYPPWAALHFNQPNRGWPPPPRLTPIIVPSHLTSSTPTAPSSTSTSVPSSRAQTHAHSASPFTTAPYIPGGSAGASAQVGGSGSAPNKKAGRTKSSLHRAVMEKLEVQRAMGEASLDGMGGAGVGGGGVFGA